MKILFIGTAPDVGGDKGLVNLLSGNTVEALTSGVDRGGLERALRSDQYDAVHYVGHGQKGLLQLADGEIDAADFVSMCEAQKGLRFVFVNACNSLSLGVALHNALHVPVIAHDASILVPAALRFAETFYRAFRQLNDVAAAFDRGIRTLARLDGAFPDQALVPQLVNGDMATRAQISDLKAELVDAYHHFNDRLDTFGGDIAELKADMKRLHQPNRMTLVMVMLGALLLAQLLTPWLNAVFGR